MPGSKLCPSGVGVTVECLLDGFWDDEILVWDFLCGDIRVIQIANLFL